MGTRKIVRAAAVQAASPNYDLAVGVDKTIELARQARDEGCDLIVFGETWSTRLSLSCLAGCSRLVPEIQRTLLCQLLIAGQHRISTHCRSRTQLGYFYRARL